MIAKIPLQTGQSNETPFKGYLLDLRRINIYIYIYIYIVMVMYSLICCSCSY